MNGSNLTRSSCDQGGTTKTFSAGMPFASMRSFMNRSSATMRSARCKLCSECLRDRHNIPWNEAEHLVWNQETFGSEPSFRRAMCSLQGWRYIGSMVISRP
jgi:hypothetical protein